MDSSGKIELVGFGLLFTIAAILVLVGLVRELAPAKRYNWLLGVGLGTGVVSFAMKIGLVVLFGNSTLLQAFIPEPKYGNIGSVGTANITAYQPEKLSERWTALPLIAPVPEDNPQTPAKIALGKSLFNDKRLSYDGSLSCASCHELSLKKGGADGRSSSVGIAQQRGDRNAPTVLNAAFQRVLFWDGRAGSLEEQALGPLLNPIEMGMPSPDAVEKRVAGIVEYRQRFAEAFPGERNITAGNVAKAIAAFERTLITPESPYDRFVEGNLAALTVQQRRGMALFDTTGCTHCHSGPNFSEASVFSDNSAYRIFPAISNEEFEQRYNLVADRGLANTNPLFDKGIWRVPSLRNVALTAPYFHNGSVDTLDEAVRVMATVQLGKVLSDASNDDRAVYWLKDDKMFNVSANQALSDSEVNDIVAFLESLSGNLPGEL
ncbi:cytochrome c peroxidase [Amphritea sp.]|uniref:cytochrome-c peroxidase n=1 Tax=Amphritea sp. TaxID=1872502 RepID=UPI0025C5C450|nr:cytochrome c peroxidase [Amphritea sp.]